eukprot:TRINITY_DN3023_c0_g1_i3.p1 TRINITY_DN3023_c0_g1~~TRINITY_DN3023_c0_g1_i3.p1  ORF type:complete len:1009 (+),score=334.56 TRINITY_DN3023_c0_g1_i3:187-3027(+)
MGDSGRSDAPDRRTTATRSWAGDMYSGSAVSFAQLAELGNSVVSSTQNTPPARLASPSSSVLSSPPPIAPPRQRAPAPRPPQHAPGVANGGRSTSLQQQHPQLPQPPNPLPPQRPKASAAPQGSLSTPLVTLLGPPGSEIRPIDDITVGTTVVHCVRGEGEVTAVEGGPLGRKYRVLLRSGTECTFPDSAVTSGALKPKCFLSGLGQPASSSMGTPASRPSAPAQLPSALTLPAEGLAFSVEKSADSAAPGGASDSPEAPLLQPASILHGLRPTPTIAQHPRKSSMASGNRRLEQYKLRLSVPESPETEDTGQRPGAGSGDTSDASPTASPNPAHHRPSRARITTVIESTTGVKKSSALREAGMDVLLLKESFEQLAGGGGEQLSMEDFRLLWRSVHPGRPIDGAAWDEQQELFEEIDIDGRGVISWEEMIAYLERHCQDELARKKRPQTLAEWCWQFAGPDAQFDWAEQNRVRAERVEREGLVVANRLRLARDKALVQTISCFKLVSQVFVLLSIGLILYETLPSMQKDSARSVSLGTPVTQWLEVVCVTFFTIELVVYVYGFPRQKPRTLGRVPLEDDADGLSLTMTTAQKEGEEAHRCPIWPEKIRPLCFDTNLWIDMLSVLPFYISLLVEAMSSGSSEVNEGAHRPAPLAVVRVARLFRLLRVLRILKIGRGKFSRVPQLGAALRRAIVSVYFLVLLIIITICLSSCFIFYAELDDVYFNGTLEKWVRKNTSEYDDKGNVVAFQSIPDAMWWSIVTLTTVGYGDQSPVTPLGKIVASVTMLTGLIVVGFPITILTSTFQAMEAEREDQERRTQRCRDFYQGMHKWIRRGAALPPSDDPRLSSSFRYNSGSSVQLRKRSLFSPRAGSVSGSPRHATEHSNIRTEAELQRLDNMLLRIEDRLITRLQAVEDAVLESAARSEAGDRRRSNASYVFPGRRKSRPSI